VRLASTVQILPIALLIACVLGILYAGVATPTEAGAMGAAAAFAICALRRRLGVRAVVEVLLETVKVTSFLFIIIIGANTNSLGDWMHVNNGQVETVDNIKYHLTKGSSTKRINENTAHTKVIACSHQNAGERYRSQTPMRCTR